MQQTTSTIVMVSPDTFQFNIETAKTNGFQQDISVQNVRDQALQEFNDMLEVLSEHDIKTIVLASRENVVTPDAVFPNNWFSTHKLRSGKRNLILYPMLHHNRRIERQSEILCERLSAQDIAIDQIIDLTEYEKSDLALEGTGSILFDRVNEIAYAAISPRAQQTVLEKLCGSLDYSLITFHSYDKNDALIYHANVVMSIGVNFAVVCLESIRDVAERASVLASLQKTHKDIIDITLEQVYGMAGNILEVKSASGTPKVVMSTTAFQAYATKQLQQLESHAEIVVVAIDTIEKLGGGSARCMMAEVF